MVRSTWTVKEAGIVKKGVFVVILFFEPFFPQKIKLTAGEYHRMAFVANGIARVLIFISQIQMVDVEAKFISAKMQNMLLRMP
jgi:hypothetical protein